MPLTTKKIHFLRILDIEKELTDVAKKYNKEPIELKQKQPKRLVDVVTIHL